MIGFIYMTTNHITGKKYIGKRQTNWRKHEIDSYLGSSKVLKDDIEKYGRDNFSRVILEYAESKEELGKLEIEYLRKYNAVDDDSFYNYTIPRLSWSQGWEKRKRNPESVKKTADKLRGVKRPNYKRNKKFNKMDSNKERMILSLHNEGLTPYQIAMKINFHADGVIRVLHDNKITPVKKKRWQNKWNKNQEEELLKLYNEGNSCKEISTIIGRGIAAISSKLKLLNIQLRDANSYKKRSGGINGTII